MAELIAQRLTLFWRTMAIAAIPFALVVWRVLWLLGRAGADAGRPGPIGARGVLAAAARGPSCGWRPFLQHLCLDGLLHRRLWHSSRWRWLAHAAVLVGFLGLMAMSAVAAVADHILRPLGLATAAVTVILNKDHPLMALTNETFGVLLLVGGLAQAVRRLAKRQHLPNERPDMLAVGLLLFVAISGWPVEAFRLLMEGTPAAVAWRSYLGWLLAGALAPLSLPWAVWHFWAFAVHVLASIALFLYWPLSKMTHVVAGPIIAGIGGAEARSLPGSSR